MANEFNMDELQQLRRIGRIMYRLTAIASDNSEHLSEEYDEADISDALEAMYIHAADTSEAGV